MTGVVTYILTFGRLPELDRQGRPKMFYSQRIHDKCYRRAAFRRRPVRRGVGRRRRAQGYCLYKMGCKGPTTYNACSTVRWNNGVSFPIQSGHGCIGCSENGFWDKGSFYDRLTTINAFGVEQNADMVGGDGRGDRRRRSGGSRRHHRRARDHPTKPRKDRSLRLEGDQP